MAFLFVWATLQVPKFLAPQRLLPGKVSTYESGEVPLGSARGPVDLQYYLYVLLFLVLDVEAVFLFPWILELVQKPELVGQVGTGPFLAEMGLFVGLLLFGWIYSWQKGALRWQG